MKRIRNFILSSMLLLSFGLSLAPAVVHADAKADACNAIGAGSTCGTTDGVDIGHVVRIVINVFSIVTGITAVIMVITGGFKYITSAGDSNKVTSAKNTIIYALIGLVIVAFAQAIVQFTLNRATK